MDYGNVSFENFYQGGATSLNPDYGNFSGYRMSAAQLGFPGSPQTANQLGETVNALKQGVKAFEVTMLQADTAETIPIQHFKEMRALMKLSGVKPSVHGPMIDAAGFDEKGSWGGDDARENNEKRMFDTLEKAYTLGPEGNIPVVFHSSAGVPGTEWKPGDEKFGEDRFIMNRGAAINQETGQAIGLSREYKFRPGLDPTKSYRVNEKTGMREEVKGGPAGVLFDAEGGIDSANSTEWDKKLLEVAEMNKRASEIIGDAPTNLPEYRNAQIDVANKKIIGMDEGGRVRELPWFNAETGQEQSYSKMAKAGLFLENAEQSFGGAFHYAYKYGTDKQKMALKSLAERYSNNIKHVGQNEIWNPVKRRDILDSALSEMKEITESRSIERNGKLIRDENYGAPKLYREAGEFAIEKAADTFGNLAMKSYEELGADKSPMIAIEPFHFGGGISKTEEVIDLVKKARDTFSTQLVLEKGVDSKEADKIAEKKIGVTWDMGHINMMKKYGFKKEDIVEATKKIAPMVKHIHVTDNFGYADTHLAPGMGNVPIKEILEQLEKTGRLGEMRKIVESGAFVQHFKKSPFPLSLAAFGSPIYGMKAGPNFGQAIDIQGAYFGGYGNTNPATHHSMYGAGFTTMPIELGGQMPGGASRFGGTPMA